LFVIQTLLIGPKHHHGHPGSWLPGKSRLSYDDLERILFDTPDPKKAEEWSRYYTSGPHLAGKNLSQVGIPQGIRRINPEILRDETIWLLYGGLD
jgi:N-acetylated-alpha-linked acidic dipeptidase